MAVSTDNYYDVVLVGEGGVGKSSLTIQFVRRFFLEIYDPTIEDHYRKQVAIDDEVAFVNVHDTAGQECYRVMLDSSLHSGQAYICAFSLAERRTFEAIKAFAERIYNSWESRGFADDAWTGKHVPVDQLKSVATPDAILNKPAAKPRGKQEKARAKQVFPDFVPMVLVGNKSDVGHREVSQEEAQELADSIGAVYMETSAKYDINVDEAFFNAVRLVRLWRAEKKDLDEGKLVKKKKRGALHALKSWWKKMCQRRKARKLARNRFAFPKASVH
mmetsp:Transcript_46485/g.119963  ORF Transcript_46485/g.119963 Transcript_46485/m.119963 type:complete len:274 (-) Transcript_46485:107-928(-)